MIAEDTRTGERRALTARALFVFIGAQPHGRWLAGQLALDRSGYVLTGAEAAQSEEPFLLQTSRPGVFAAGDVRGRSIKRVASAVGEGAMAVRFVHEYLAGSSRRRA